MIEMRAKIAVAVFLLSSSSGLAKDLPTSVTYSLGGVMSGPYRISADLIQGTVSEAKSPPGMLGDRAGLKTADLLVTDEAKLTPKETRALRRATDVIWRESADIFSVHYHAPDPAYEKWRRETNDGRKPGSPPPTITAPDFSCNTLDALGDFEIVKGGKTRTYQFSTPCMTPNAEKLLHMLVGAIHPDQVNANSPRTR